MSNFDEDATLFNYAASKQIEIGKSTKQDVLKRLGKPAGKAYCPTNIEDYKSRCENTSEIWVWAYTTKLSGNDSSTMKKTQVFITFDENEIVSNVELSKES